MQSYKRAKAACYTTNIAMSVVSNISPVLFLTFKHMYGISYSLLGLLVLINFVTQLSIDLVFSFFSHKFNIQKTVKITPILTVIGLAVYALWPFFLPNSTYIGLVIGTVIFSASGGLAEVLISPVIAAIPSKNPEREMSKLHSIYAWGVVGVVLVATLFIFFFDNSMWQWLVLTLMIIPLIASILFFNADLPVLSTPEKVSGATKFLKTKSLWLCVLAIFLGGICECTMAQWCSGYIEGALGIPKIYGDIFGVALFAVMLGTGRSLYAKIGKNIYKVLFWGAVGSTVCYAIAVLSPWPIAGLFACALSGFCVSMMWPGSLVVASSRIPDGGVFIFAMMAAGGDLGASIGPQLVGIISDIISVSSTAHNTAQTLCITAEQLGMKIGLGVGLLFSLIAVFVYLYIWKKQKSTNTDTLKIASVKK